MQVKINKNYMFMVIFFIGNTLPCTSKDISYWIMLGFIFQTTIEPINDDLDKSLGVKNRI